MLAFAPQSGWTAAGWLPQAFAAAATRRGGKVLPLDPATAFLPDVSRALQAACAFLDDGDPPAGVSICLADSREQPQNAWSAGFQRARAMAAVAHPGQLVAGAWAAARLRTEAGGDASLLGLGTCRLRDLRTAEPIYQVLRTGRPSEFPPLRSLDAVPHNLPVQLAPFIGRRDQVADLSSHLLRQARLVTLVGAGGCGKTRLALQVAAQVLPGFPGGVWMVDLAAIGEDAPARAVAAALRCAAEVHKDALATVAARVGDRRLLLLLDNCEHVLPAAAAMAEALLRACPNLRVLATSRQALGVAGEIAWRVPSLPVHAGPAVSEAVALFLDRARAVQPDLQPTGPQMGTIADICRQLDGIPLAIELAAARVNLLTVEQLAERLGDRFALLTAGRRTALPRHRTLWSAIDWSHDLLAEREKVLWRRLSAFAGGFTLAAAEAVVAASELAQEDVLPLLSELLDKSLVQAEAQRSETRYRLLETVRLYGAERLEEAGETAAIGAAHLRYFLGFAEAAQPGLVGAELAGTLERLEAEHDNLRHALHFAAATEDWEASLRLGAALWRFWERRGYAGEGGRWLRQALGATEERRTAVRADALIAAANLAYDQGDFAAARGLCRQCLALCTDLGDRRGMGRCHNSLGVIAEHQGDYAGARDHLEQAAAVAREMGNRWAVATTLNNLASVVRKQGELAAAAAMYGESLGLFRALGESWGVAMSLCDLARTAQQRGDRERAGRLYRESLALRQTLKDQAGAAEAIECLAGLTAAGRGAAARAVQLFGSASALRERSGAPPAEDEAPALHRALAAAKAQLPAARFAEMWAAGRALTLDSAIALALQDPGPPPPAATAALTPRETEILRLIAGGLTAREIGSRLHLSHRTVQKQEERLRAKLQAPNRPALAAWAAHHLD